MDQSQLNSTRERDVYVRGKYRDVILPMTVLRRLDAVLEPTKQAVLDMKAALDREKVANQDDALRVASGQAFYNTSPFLLRDLKARATQRELKDRFRGLPRRFLAQRTKDIPTNFEFRNQVAKGGRCRPSGIFIERTQKTAWW